MPPPAIDPVVNPVKDVLWVCATPLRAAFEVTTVTKEIDRNIRDQRRRKMWKEVGLTYRKRSKERSNSLNFVLAIAFVSSVSL